MLESMMAEKRRVALSSVLAALGITAMKVLVGISTHSLGILSEAAHSGLDLVAAMVTLLSVRVSDKPADAEHQYGHGKVENFSACIETGLLLLTCVWIVWEASRRLAGHHAVHIEPTIAAFTVLAVSMFVDWWRSRELRRIARKYDSQALEAHALHFSTDIFSSAVVMLGLGLVALGHFWPRNVWLGRADSIAALVVSVIIVFLSWPLSRQTIDQLLDAAPAGYRTRIADERLTVDAVIQVQRLRIPPARNPHFPALASALSRTST